MGFVLVDDEVVFVGCGVFVFYCGRVVGVGVRVYICCLVRLFSGIYLLM